MQRLGRLDAYLYYSGAVFLVMVAVFPIYWTLISSLKSPAELISASKDNTVARCWDGIRPFTYAWRTGLEAAAVKAHATRSTMAAQKLAVHPMRMRLAELSTAPARSTWPTSSSCRPA